MFVWFIKYPLVVDNCIRKYSGDLTLELQGKNIPRTPTMLKSTFFRALAFLSLKLVGIIDGVFLPNKKHLVLSIVTDAYLLNLFNLLQMSLFLSVFISLALFWLSFSSHLEAARTKGHSKISSNSILFLHNNNYSSLMCSRPLKTHITLRYFITGLTTFSTRVQLADVAYCFRSLHTSFHSTLPTFRRWKVV